MRILFVSLEFSPAFSGNGIYSQSQVRSLCLSQQVLVLCAVPPGQSPACVGDHQVLQVPVSRWGRLDSTAPWEEFAAGAGAHVPAIHDFDPELPAWRAIQAITSQGPNGSHSAAGILSVAYIQHSQRVSARIPYVWLNYRVFSRTETASGLELVSRLESEAMDGAIATVVLSRSDRDYLTQHVATHAGRAVPQPEVLLCALRADMMHAAVPPDVLSDEANTGDYLRNTCPAPALSLEGSNNLTPAAGVVNGLATDPAALPHNRRYLICVVRLVPEKEPHRFVELVAELQRRGVLEQHNLIPLMLGAANDEYSKRVRTDLQQAARASVLLDNFMGPAELSQLYSQAVLNVHPATYDAFGMTIVEAASQGCPSLVHDGGGAVGATDLLRADHNEVILTDLTQPIGRVAQQVEELLKNTTLLQAVRRAAAVRARSWDEAANAQALLEITHKALQQHKQGH